MRVASLNLLVFSQARSALWRKSTSGSPSIPPRTGRHRERDAKSAKSEFASRHQTVAAANYKGVFASAGQARPDDASLQMPLINITVEKVDG